MPNRSFIRSVLERKWVNHCVLCTGLLLSGFLIWKAAPSNSAKSQAAERADAELGLVGSHASTSSKIPIEEVRVGDLALARNPETGEQEYKRVAEVFRRESVLQIFAKGMRLCWATLQSREYGINL